METIFLFNKQNKLSFKKASTPQNSLTGQRQKSNPVPSWKLTGYGATYLKLSLLLKRFPGKCSDDHLGGGPNTSHISMAWCPNKNLSHCFKKNADKVSGSCLFTVAAIYPAKGETQPSVRVDWGRLIDRGLRHSNLPASQTPIPKRIYTKAHSLNLSLLGLYPESKGSGGTGMEEREGQHYA